jgi:hypothetical protein
MIRVYDVLSRSSDADVVSPFGCYHALLLNHIRDKVVRIWISTRLHLP